MQIKKTLLPFQTTELFLERLKEDAEERREEKKGCCFSFTKINLKNAIN